MKKSVSLEKWEWQEIKTILRENEKRELYRLETTNAKILKSCVWDDQKIEAHLNRLAVIRALLKKL